MAGLNMAIIKEMPIQVAPIKLQQEFVRRSAGVETLRSAENASLSKLDDFLGTLQHHAFAGNL
jgi:type I restriction enzyme S subunit